LTGKSVLGKRVFITVNPKGSLTKDIAMAKADLVQILSRELDLPTKDASEALENVHRSIV
jgi:hypothetical protein